MEYSNNSNNNNYSDNEDGNGSFRVAPPNPRPDPYAQRGGNYPNYGNQMAQQVGQGVAANIGENVAEKVADNLGQRIKQSAGGALQNFKRQATNIMSDPQKRKQIQADITSFGKIDKQVWQIVSDVQVVPSPCSWILALINLFLPGFGTIMSSCFGNSCSKTQFSVGILQVALGPFIVGYIWSWFWAYLIIKKSISANNEDDEDDEDSFERQKVKLGRPSDQNVDNHQQFYDDENRNNQFEIQS